MNKKESKYFGTAEKMDRALIELLEKKDFEYITVKEICERAEVNRSTFYLHYQNTADLLKEATRYVVDGFLKYFPYEGENRQFDAVSQSLEDLNFMTPQYVIPYLTYIKDNRRVFKTALAHLGVMGFEEYYDRLFAHIFDPILSRFGVDASERQYVMKFYLTGATAVSLEWLKNNCREPAEKICNIIISCTTNGYPKNEKN